MSVSELVERVLDLQSEYSKDPTEAMLERSVIIRATLRDALEGVVKKVGPFEVALEVEGSDGAGNKSRVPWVRIFSPTHSPGARVGWYVVLLFSADGDACYLSLNFGATVWKNGNMVAQAPTGLHLRAEAARDFLKDGLDGLAPTIELHDVGSLGKAYEASNVGAVKFEHGTFPGDDTLGTQLKQLLEVLCKLYERDEIEQGDEGGPAPAHAKMLRPIEADDDLVAYCHANSSPKNPVTFTKTHCAFYVSNQTNKRFVLLSADVIEALDAIWASPECAMLGSYDEVTARSVFAKTLKQSPAGSLAESQTRPVWEVLRIAGGYRLGLSSADPSAVFAAEGQVPPPFIADPPMVALKASFSEMNLNVDESFARQCLAAIGAGKHLLLVGPPGTGKTSVALALARYAMRVGLSRGHLLVTGTTDWTSGDTLGGYWLYEDQVLRFRPGFILQSVRDSRWLIVDEFNRADLDKCLGPFLTVLSGQAASLPHLVEDGGRNRHVEIMQGEGPSTPSRYQVNSSWRMIGTMNTWDRDVLFDMSFALKRRLAIIEVPALNPAVVGSLVESLGEESQQLATKLAGLEFGDPAQPLGVGILLDFCRFEKGLRDFEPDAGAASGSVVEALLATIIPQFQHLKKEHREAAVRLTSEALGLPDADRARMRAALLMRSPEGLNQQPNLAEALAAAAEEPDEPDDND